MVVCGPGNNGADGVAAGRILFFYRVFRLQFLPFERNNCSKEMQLQLTIAENLGIIINNSCSLIEYNIIIDAIFGIGLSKPIRGELAELISEINRGNYKVFSADIPQGYPLIREKCWVPP